MRLIPSTCWNTDQSNQAEAEAGPDGLISAGEGTVRVMPAVGSNEEMDLFGLVLDYRDSVARGFDQVIVIVGSNQYFFSSGAYPICQQPSCPTAPSARR